MTQRVTKPIALDRSFNTTESTPRNIADVLAENLLAIKEAIENGADTGGAFIVSYGSTTAQQIYDAIRENKVPYLYYNGVVAQLWKVETNKYTFRTTETRVVDSQTYLDIIDYSVTGVTWDTNTKTISGGSGGQTPYFAKASSVSPFDTTGKSGSQEVVYIDDVPEDGVYQVSVLMGVTPQIAAASKSDLVFKIVSAGSDRMNNSFHAIVDDSEVFAQQVSFSLSLTLKAGRNSLVLECDNLTISYLVSVDIMTIASLVNGSSSGGGGGDQFVLTRSDMTSAFTNTEYQDCIDAASDGKAVCVLFTLNGGDAQAQLTQYQSNGVLVFEFDAGVYHHTFQVAGVAGAHTVTDVTTRNGSPIYATLQAAIDDAAALPSGSFFETNGFHSYDDGGGGRYLVNTSVGSANGKNCILLGSSGKVAWLQYGDWIVPEQLGYQQSYSRDDVVPYVTHAISLGCQHIHFRSSGNGAGYTWKTKLTVSVKGFKLTGEGDWGYPNKFSYIVFRPTDSSVTSMIDMRARDVLIKDLDIEVTGDYVKLVNGITCGGYESDENRFWEFDNVRFNSFKDCIMLGGGIKWQNSIKNCLFNSCKNGLHIYESSTFELLVENCLFTNCETNDVFVEGSLFSGTFTNCGFGSLGTAVTLGTNADTYLYQNIRFQGCNFEIDTTTLVNAPAVFIDCFPDSGHPYIRQNITIANCHFTPIKQSYTDQGTTNRYIRLAPKTNLLLISNQILGKDEPQYPDWVLYPKLIWNENYLPTYGSIVECGANTVGNGFFEYPDALLPYVTRNTQARSLVAHGATSGVDSAISDCNTFIPKYSGEVIVGRASTYENTANMPTTSIFGFIFSMGVVVDPNKRVLQYMIASNSNMYTRIGKDTGNGWTFDPWKTITAT